MLFVMICFRVIFVFVIGFFDISLIILISLSLQFYMCLSFNFVFRMSKIVFNMHVI